MLRTSFAVAGLTGLILAASGTAAKPRISALKPLIAACAAYYDLRQKEGGKPAPATLQRLSAENADALFRRAEAFGYSGGFQLTGKGETILSKGYGMADRGRGLPIRRDTIFDIGSVTKQFTAAAILRLEEMGRLSTSDSISVHFAAVPADKQAITIHHLLTNSSGLPLSAGESQDPISRQEAVRHILGLALKAPPGEKYSYSNPGFVLLAAIVEQSSGRSYELFLREQLWLPTGMKQTGMVLGGLDRARPAESWFFDGPQPASLARFPGRNGLPTWRSLGAGSVVSTMADLERWGEALRTGRILSDASRRKLFWPHMREDGEAPSYYGYGWALGSASDGSCRIGHNGSGGLHYAFMSFLPQRDALLIAFDTQERTPWSHFADRAWPALFGGSITLPPVAGRPAGQLAAMAGDYQIDRGGTLPVRLQGGRLFIDTINADALRLFSPWPMLATAQVARLGDRQALIAEVMNGIARGDHGPLLDRLRKSVDKAGEAGWWKQRWPEWIREKGRYLGTDLAGTVLMPEGTGPAEDRLRSLALARFERGTIALGFVHDPDGRIFIDWMPQYFDRHIFLAPQEDGSFLAYRPVSKRRLTVRFETSDRDGAQILLVDNGQMQAPARRRTTAAVTPESVQ